MINLYSVKDAEAQIYIKPFGMQTDRDAIDGFRHVCNEEESPYYKHPKDYSLVKLGKFDERTGLFETHEPKKLMEAMELKKGN